MTVDTANRDVAHGRPRQPLRHMKLISRFDTEDH